ncbi:MAG: phosphatase PAP2 family protein [Novosphingobium sp.]
MKKPGVTQITAKKIFIGTLLENPVNVNGVPAAWLLTAIALSGLVVAALLERTGLVVPLANQGAKLVFGIMLVLLALRIILRRPLSLAQRRLRDFSENMLIFLAICFLGVIASYPAAAESTGFSDPMLAHMDRLLHFDWIAWYLAISGYPSLRLASMVAYAAIYVSPIIIMAYYACSERTIEAREFLLTFWLATLVTLLLFPLFPAAGPLAFLWHGPIPYMPTSALYQEQLIPALRSHQVSVIDLGALRGLVCAPSFHTAAGVLYMIAAWPIRRLRWILVPINVAMLVATPIEGTHYLVDMIAGMLVALFATCLVKGGLYFRAASNSKILYG